MQKLYKAFWLTVISLTVFMAVTLSLVRIAMPYAERYIGQLEQFASSTLGMDITIGRLDSGWQGLGPALRFEDVRVINPHNGEQVSFIQYVDIQLDVFASILKRDWVLGRLTIDGLVMHIEQTPGSNKLDIVPWPLLHEFKRIMLKNAVIHWAMKKGEPLVFNVDKFYVYPKKEKERIELSMNIGNPDSRIQLIVDTEGDWIKPNEMIAEGFLRLKNLSLDKRYMPHIWGNLNWVRGAVDSDLWFRYDKGEWEKIIGHTDLSSIVVKNIRTKERLAFSLSGDMAFTQTDLMHQRFVADDVELHIEDTFSPLNAWVIDMDKQKPWQVKLNAVSLFDAISVARLFDYLSADLEKQITAHDPKALLHHIAWDGLPGDDKQWHLGFQISDGYQLSDGQVPGFDHLSGTVKITPTHGEFNMDSEHLTLVVPKVYSKAIEIDKVQGLVTWTQAPFTINTDKFFISNRDMSLTLDLNVQFPPSGGSPHMLLDVETSPLTHEDILYYLPDKVLKKGLYQWISESYKSGDVSVATAHVEGNVNQFPFAEGPGMFELKFALHNGVLDYKTGWPLIQDIDAQLVIDGKKFQAYIDSGRYRDTVIQQAVAAIDYTDLTKPLILDLSGDLQGSASDAEQFLRDSPLWQTLGGGFSWVDIEGMIDTRLDLQLPLDDLSEPQAAGKVTLSAATVIVPAADITFNNVTGSVNFKNGCMSAENIHATFFNHTAMIGTSCKISQAGITHAWVLNSAFDQSDIDTYLDPRFRDLIQGSSTYSATLFTAAGSRESTLSVSSNLQGVTIHAPPTFAKTADQIKMTTIDLPLKSSDQFTPVITYDGLLSVGLLFKKEAEKIVLKGANIVLGKEKAMPPAHETYNISGHIQALHIDDWLEYLERFKVPAEKPVMVHGGFWVDTLYYKDFRLDEVNLSWKRLANAWRVILDGPGAVGTVTMPDQPSVTEPLSLQFKRYVWKANPNIGKHSFDVDPRLLPPIDFYCEAFFYRNQLLGELDIVMRPSLNGVTFDPITVESPIHSVAARGSWTQNNTDPAITLFEGKAKTKNIADTLAAAGVNGDIENAKADATFDVHWTGSPGQFSLGTVVGNVDVKLGKGRLMGVNPGLGRLLGLFSVESIARRLQFDFSDLFAKGFAFDSFEANITTSKGYAYTTDATLKAPAANITLSGKMGLVDQSLDMDLDVRSTANSTVPTIGAAALAIANPFAGAAVWLAGKVFNPLEGLGHYRYHVTGTWESPVFNDVTSQLEQPTGK